jgi:hypothetical protein
MDLHFVSPVLADLDSLESEVLACSVWEEQRPSKGVAGLCDWRFAGRLSRLQSEGFFSGRIGELLLLQGRPRMRFDKVLFVGCGPRDTFDEARFRDVLRAMMQSIEKLKARTTVAQLPGRQCDIIPAERAADLLLEVATRGASRGHHDAWTLVEDLPARRRIEQHMVEERRRIRRLR